MAVRMVDWKGNWLADHLVDCLVLTLVGPMGNWKVDTKVVPLDMWSAVNWAILWVASLVMLMAGRSAVTTAEKWVGLMEEMLVALWVETLVDLKALQLGLRMAATLAAQKVASMVRLTVVPTVSLWVARLDKWKDDLMADLKVGRKVDCLVVSSVSRTAVMKAEL